jgi:hypothetical protein
VPEKTRRLENRRRGVAGIASLTEGGEDGAAWEGNDELQCYEAGGRTVQLQEKWGEYPASLVLN